MLLLLPAPGTDGGGNMHTGARGQLHPSPCAAWPLGAASGCSPARPQHQRLAQQQQPQAASSGVLPRRRRVLLLGREERRDVQVAAAAAAAAALAVAVVAAVVAAVAETWR